MMDSQQLLDIVGEIYEASLDPRRWDEVVATLCQLLDVKSGALLVHDQETGSHSVVGGYGINAITKASYSLGLGKLDIGWKAVIGRAEGEAFQFASHEETKHQHPFYYHMLMKPLNIHYMGGICIYNSPEWRVALGLHRDLQQGAFDEQTFAPLEALAPHFARAMRIQKEFHRLRVENFRLANALSKVMLGIVIVNEARRIVYTNPIADMILSQHPALNRRSDLLLAYNQAETAQLNNAIDALLQADHPAAHHPGLGLTHPEKLTPLAVILNKANASHAREDLLLPAHGVAIYLTDPDMAINISPDTLNRIYALTPAESRVAIQIANGLSVKEIAADNQVSVLTVRTQLRNVFEKMGVNRQQDIVKILLSGSFNQPEPHHHGKTSHPPSLAEDRQLDKSVV